MRAGGETGAVEGEVPPPPPPPPQAATSIAVHMANENFTCLVFMAAPPSDHSAPVQKASVFFTWEWIGSRFDAAREAQFHTAYQLTCGIHRKGRLHAPGFPSNGSRILAI